MAKTKEKATLRGAELARVVINHIIDNPKEWNQSAWHCGTTHCFFGWCQLKGGLPQDSDTCFSDASDLLGLIEADANWISHSHRSLSDIHGFVKSMIEGRPSFDRDGFDRDGYDREGFNRDGFGRGSFDRDGYDRDGKKLEKL